MSRGSWSDSSGNYGSWKTDDDWGALGCIIILCVLIYALPFWLLWKMIAWFFGWWDDVTHNPNAYRYFFGHRDDWRVWLVFFIIVFIGIIVALPLISVRH